MAMPCPGTPFTAHAMGPGGGDRIRTDDRLVANQVLYQLSYAPDLPNSSAAMTRSLPALLVVSLRRPGATPQPHLEPAKRPWWACVDLNHGPPAYQADALTN